MKLLIVTQDFPPLHGGIQTYMGALAAQFATEVEELHVLAPQEEGAQAWDAQQNFQVHRVAMPSSFLVAGLWPKLGSLIRAKGIEAVLFAQWFPALAMPRIQGVRVGVIAHGREYLNHPLGALGLKLMPWALNKADVIIPNSNRTALLVPAAFKHKIRVVHPGVDSRKFSPASPDQILALKHKWGLDPQGQYLTVLTRLVPRKGIDTLIQTFNLLAPKHPQLQLLIGGKGPDLERLQQLHQASPYADRIRFLGRIEDEDLNAFYGMGLFCLLSREEKKDIEGFGLVLAEAASCGAAVVCARSGGMPEAVLEHQSALVVPPMDPHSSAEQISTLLEDPQRLQDYQRQGREFALKLSWEKCAQQILQSLSPN